MLSGSSVEEGEYVVLLHLVVVLLLFISQNIKSYIYYPARALRALGLLLADGTPTVGGGKTF